MKKLNVLKEGKAKRFYETDDPDFYWVEYLNQATALNGKRKEAIAEKGILNNKMDSLIFNYLKTNGIATHFVKQLSDNEQLVQAVTMIPLEVVVRNAASGSFQRKFKQPYLAPLDPPVVEFFYKSDALDDPFMNAEQAAALKVVTLAESQTIEQFALKINELLLKRFAAAELQLVDFKVEFGRTKAGELVLADEISPDSCRLVDMTTKDSLDKDVFRKHTGDLTTVYHEVLQRLENSEVAHVSR